MKFNSQNRPNLKSFKSMIVSIFISVTLLSCGGKSTKDCNGDIRAYEYGREMQTWVELRGTGNLDQAIEEYSEQLGVEPPYDPSNECVRRGFDDANSNIESPYNKEGKSWSTF
jgi:hypothetical protein